MYTFSTAHVHLFEGMWWRSLRQGVVEISTLGCGGDLYTRVWWRSLRQGVVEISTLGTSLLFCGIFQAAAGLCRARSACSRQTGKGFIFSLSHIYQIVLKGKVSLYSLSLLCYQYFFILFWSFFVSTFLFDQSFCCFFLSFLLLFINYNFSSYAFEPKLSLQIKRIYECFNHL